MYVFQEISNKWVLAGNTEMIQDTVNPKFITAIPLTYKFEGTVLYFNSQKNKN